ncbi:hypothetical protein ACH4M4_36295 [Streptomyces sp. NPDC017254]|uniref:hypothetical protein n=1 Tax=unclassified Streptomyces TaxID=2593676 RepID=UPI0037BC41AB
MGRSSAARPSASRIRSAISGSSTYVRRVCARLGAGADFEIAVTFTPRDSGAHRFGAGGVGELTLTIAGRTLFEGTRAPATDAHLAAFVAGSEAQVIVDLTAGLYGDGHRRRDCTYVDHAVSATIAAATVPTAQGVINVGGGSGASLLEVISIARGLTGREVQVHQEHPRSGDVLTITERPRRPLPRPRKPTSEGNDPVGEIAAACPGMTTLADRFP